MDESDLMRKYSTVFYPRLSKHLLVYLFVLHVFAAVCIMAFLTGGLLYLFLFVILVSGIFYLCNVLALFSNHCICALQYLKDRQWRISMVNGETSDMILHGKSILTRYLVILHFVDQQHGVKRHLLLFPDSLPNGRLRLLRYYVRMGFL